MEQSENAEKTAKALNTNPADLQTENRSEKSNFWLRKRILMILFTVLLIFAVIIVVLAVLSSGSGLNQAAASCPVHWIGSQGRTYPWKCYYFSEVEGDWNSTQRNCSSLAASLATVDTLEEKEFMLRYQRRSETWIGLTREADEPWKWVNGTVFNNLNFSPTWILTLDIANRLLQKFCYYTSNDAKGEVTPDVEKTENV